MTTAEAIEKGIALSQECSPAKNTQTGQMSTAIYGRGPNGRQTNPPGAAALGVAASEGQENPSPAWMQENHKRLLSTLSDRDRVVEYRGMQMSLGDFVEWAAYDLWERSQVLAFVQETEMEVAA